MFLALLLASAVAAEWVEIAQHRQDTPRFTSRTPANNIYTNHTATDRAWHRSSVGTPHYGSVKRVQLQSPGSMFSNAKNDGYESFGSVRAPPVIRKDHLVDHDNAETDTDEETPHIFGKNNAETNRDQTLRYSTSSEKPYIQRHNEYLENTEISTKNIQQDSRISDKTKQRNPNIKRVQSEPHGVITKVNEKDTKLSLKISDKISDKPSEASTNINETPKIAKGVLEDRTTSTQTPFSFKPATKLINDEKSSGQEGKNNATHEYFQENCTRGNGGGTTANQCQDEKHNENIVENNSQTNPVEVIWKLMKVVTDNISRNTRRSFSSKIKFLESLRNKIIANIAEERIEQAWPDDAAARARLRRAAAARGHVEFPSSESALMTISFLTFAVFLIKLVLQVIHTYKNKTMMVTPAVVAAVGRAAAALRNRRPHTPLN